MSTVVIPGTETETEKRTDKLIPGEDNKTPATQTDGSGFKGPIEWLIDDPQVSREDNDPFHILLLDETYINNPKITILRVRHLCTNYKNEYELWETLAHDEYELKKDENLT